MRGFENVYTLYSFQELENELKYQFDITQKFFF